MIVNLLLLNEALFQQPAITSADDIFEIGEGTVDVPPDKTVV